MGGGEQEREREGGGGAGRESIWGHRPAGLSTDLPSSGTSSPTSGELVKQLTFDEKFGLVKGVAYSDGAPRSSFVCADWTRSVFSINT